MLFYKTINPMEVMIPSPAGGEFNFDSTCTCPQMISSPTRFGKYLVSDCDDQVAAPLSENYGNRKQKDDTTDFTFDFSGVRQEDTNFICADELFHGGKIKPLRLMPLSQYPDFSGKDSPKTPRSPKRIITKALMSPRQKNKDSDPLLKKEKEENYLLKSNIRQEGLKSVLTLNVSNMISESVKIERSSKKTSSSSSTSSWYGKWKLTNILLFRSASEGHSTIRRSDKEDIKNLSFRSADNGGSGSRGGSRRKKGLVSAHEWHYKNRRAAAEEMRRKTFLPYKKNLLGCMDLDPGVSQFSKGLAVEIRC